MYAHMYVFGNVVLSHVCAHADSLAGAHVGKRVALHRRDASVAQVQFTALGWAGARSN